MPLLVGIYIFAVVFALIFFGDMIASLMPGLELVIGIFSIIILLVFTFLASFLEMQTWLRITLIVLGFVFSLVGISFALRIEQTAGYYMCGKCGHKHVPTYNSVLWAMHYGRTRYMKCPKCEKKSWQKKVISKDN